MNRSFIWASLVAVLLLFAATSVASAASNIWGVVKVNVECVYWAPDGTQDTFTWFDTGDEVGINLDRSNTEWTAIDAFVPETGDSSICYVPYGTVEVRGDNTPPESEGIAEIPEDPGNDRSGSDDQVITETPAPAEVPADDCVAESGEDCPGMGKLHETPEPEATFVAPTPESSEVPIASTETPISEEIPADPVKLQAPEETDEATTTVATSTASSVTMGGKEVSKLPSTGTGTEVEPWWAPFGLIGVGFGFAAAVIALLVGIRLSIDHKRQIGDIALTVYGTFYGIGQLVARVLRQDKRS